MRTITTTCDLCERVIDVDHEQQLWRIQVGIGCPTISSSSVRHIETCRPCMERLGFVPKFDKITRALDVIEPPTTEDLLREILARIDPTREDR
jgi:NADH:ubiquinone oxidoreductase subunit B-like Fe-S oxidoreductase